ncbi:hypothetical protein [Spirochaeta cellobiosiphila]|uniref:hypothetical protein n=1 Tax=Spirochaeta cellobiosiphila TaxID=504483 RepID=UPI00048CF30D|nr:hypothetical protein [Spirochaeta cellobiosiphila]
MRTVKQLFIILITILVSHMGWSNDIQPVNQLATHLTLSVLDKASEPRLWNGNILFTQKPTGNTRMVGIAFENENYKKIHLFKRNEKGVFFYLYPLSSDENDLQYRIIENGLWKPDPTNPNTETDSWGTEISRISLTDKKYNYLQSPQIIEPNVVQFSFRAEPGQTVYLCGDFNNYDPFFTPMIEKEQGVYSVSLKLLAGKHHYYYIYKGQKLTDPLNHLQEISTKGQTLSVVIIE